MRRVRLLVRGRVQGVWFRDSCREEAERLGVAGWARNLPDGSVEVVAEGGRDAVDALLAWCRVGPPQARVTDVEACAELPEGLSGFTAR